MKTRWLFVVAGGFAVLLIFVSGISTDSVTRDVTGITGAGAAHDVAPRIHVQQTVITVDAQPVAYAVPGRPLPERDAPARRAFAPTRTARAVPAEHGLMTRAKKAFFGDGRYRPEPFPRVKNE